MIAAVSATDVCRRMVDALNARDWGVLEAMLDERTAVTDHRELPFEGTGATMLAVWRSTFASTPSARADLEVLEDGDAEALVLLGMGDDQGHLAVHAVVATDGARVARFDAFPRSESGAREARARYAG
jgi:hypothetical protein